MGLTPKHNGSHCLLPNYLCHKFCLQQTISCWIHPISWHAIISKARGIPIENVSIYPSKTWTNFDWFCCKAGGRIRAFTGRSSPAMVSRWISEQLDSLLMPWFQLFMTLSHFTAIHENETNLLHIYELRYENVGWVIRWNPSIDTNGDDRNTVVWCRQAEITKM